MKLSHTLVVTITSSYVQVSCRKHGLKSEVMALCQTKVDCPLQTGRGSGEGVQVSLGLVVDAADIAAALKQTLFKRELSLMAKLSVYQSVNILLFPACTDVSLHYNIILSYQYISYLILYGVIFKEPIILMGTESSSNSLCVSLKILMS